MALRLGTVKLEEQERRVEWPACHEHNNNKFLCHMTTHQAGLNTHASSLSLRTHRAWEEPFCH